MIKLTDETWIDGNRLYTRDYRIIITIHNLVKWDQFEDSYTREQIAEAIKYRVGEPWVCFDPENPDSGYTLDHKSIDNCYLDQSVRPTVMHWHAIILTNGNSEIGKILLDWLKGK